MTSTRKSSKRSPEEALSYMITNMQHLDLSGHVFSDNPVLKAHGGYCDVFIGRWIEEGTGEYKVAIKRLRAHIRRDKDFAKLLAKEIRVWSTLAHRNILPLLGFIMEGDYPSLISEWMENGTASRYVEDHPECNVLQLFLGIAEGLEYLHERGVIHSDIKADNVLISNTGKPRICDFGISRVLAASQTLASSTGGHLRGSVRWMAIELLTVSDPLPLHTIYTDIWAFGMTVHELLSRELPFAHLKLDLHVMFAILQRHQPTRPSSFDTWPIHYQKIWNMCRACWNPDPSQRYPIHYVVSYLKFISTFTESESEAGQSIEHSVVKYISNVGNASDQMRAELLPTATIYEKVYDGKGTSNHQFPRSGNGRKTRDQSDDLPRHHDYYNSKSSRDKTRISNYHPLAIPSHSPATSGESSTLSVSPLTKQSLRILTDYKKATIKYKVGCRNEDWPTPLFLYPSVYDHIEGAPRSKSAPLYFQNLLSGVFLDTKLFENNRYPCATGFAHRSQRKSNAVVFVCYTINRNDDALSEIVSRLPTVVRALKRVDEEGGEVYSSNGKTRLYSYVSTFVT